MENKIGCSSGRLKIIDPNMFEGHDSSNNISVANEDLNISVILKTYKKGRTILTTNKEGGKSTSDTSNSVSINFIDGSSLNGKKVLTTNYTDLTAIGDDNTNNNAGEGLGITNIDIDFNSQQAPMITINFVDVRGSAIFQNEENIKDGKNKYSTFFQLPYPLFRLIIKGYYGLPVEYCLHMYKFNTKFNSQTGNFEITANFIGFTYAMLSDMLIGYLKAIPYTKIGQSRYKIINDIREKNGISKIMNLNELMIAIAKINESIQKLSANDLDAAEINNIDNKITELNDIFDILSRLGSQLDVRGSISEKYDYIIKPDVYKVDVNKIINNYKDEIRKKLVEFNKNSTIQLDNKLFELPWYFPNRSVTLLKNDILGAKEITNTRGYNIIEYINDVNNNLNDKINDVTIFDCWDLTDIFIELDNIKVKLDNSQKIAKQNLGETIRLKIKEKLKLDPTIRNIIEIFTTAVEVFMESIYSVSYDAELDKDNKRSSQLKTKFISKNSTDIKNIEKKDNSILPWPSYREKKEVQNKETFIEKYLGGKNILEKPMDVNELVFIEDLLNAFLKASTENNLANLLLNKTEISWFPINPLDTKLFNVNNSPYSRIGKNGLTSYNEVTNLMLIRGMTFLGYNNTYLTSNEIEQMAEIEVNSMINSVQDIKIKQVLGNLTLNDFINLKGNINGNENKIVSYNNNDYFYNYFPNNDFKILPINEGFSGEWVKNSENIWEFTNSENNDTKFLTNYNFNTVKKNIDGGIYIKIFTEKDFNTPINLDYSLKPDKVDITDNEIILEKLKTPFGNGNKPKDAGFNVFGGSQGIQEFINMNWGNSKYDKLPLKNIFYSNDSKFGLAIRLDATSTSIYDLDVLKIDTNDGIIYKKNSGRTTYFDDSVFNSWHPLNNPIDKIFSDIGKNWDIISNFDPKIISYPFVEAIYTKNSAGSEFEFSLFGSRWYYGQSKSPYPLYSKALLFLNTLPWNGLPFDKTEILQLFNTRAGFIHVPKLWGAYVGSLLWRLDTNPPILSNSDSKIIIGGGSGQNDPIIFKKIGNDILSPYSGDKNNFIQPNRDQSLKKLRGDISVYDNLPIILKYLPEQVKNEFKNIFFNFVHSNSVSLGNTDIIYDFNTLNENVQLVIDGDIDTFDNKLNILYGSITENSSTQNYFYINTNMITDNFINIDKYQWCIPLSDDKDLPRQINLMFKGTSDTTDSPVGIIVNMFNEEIIIANTGYNIWNQPINSTNNYYPIYCSKDNFELYFNKVINLMKSKISTTAVLEETKRKEQEIFGTTDSDSIKFQLYKTCKNIYDKWIGGVENIDDVIFQCGGTKNSVDKGLRDKYRRGDDKVRLIDSFRFVDRSFSDIGNLFYINPVPVNDYLMNSPNTSVFDAVSQLLASNHFNFIPLPTFINYNDTDTLKSMFDTNPNYNEAIKDGVCGPSFVSVYAGESSKHLDFYNSEYPNDGIDFVCGGSSKGDIIGVPHDFTNNDDNNFENDIAVFSVNYGQQNQNIFKDITLDQSEFSETDESLKISDDIANKGTENNITLGGQNIYNVYSVRSYKAEVEMLGNPMIQPMMHFQLNNIPMFHGAYLITRVKHSIKPNHMSTVFTGSRVRFPKTELLSGADFYMGILDSMNISNLGSGASNKVIVGAAASNKLGKKCGEYVIPKPIIDGVNGFSNSKPIRDLVASVESGGDYNAYNNGKASGKGSIKYKPSELTIAEIKNLQLMKDNNRIFAVGKYQLIPETFNNMVNTLKLSPNTIFDAKTQEMAGEWLILKGAGYRQGLRNYFSLNNTGSEEELQKAIDDLSLEFASFPRYYQYKTNTTVYGGTGNNPTQAKFCAQDVAKALIATWENINKNKTPIFNYDNLLVVVKNEDNNKNIV